MKTANNKRKSVIIRVCVIAFACYVAFTLISLKIEIERKNDEKTNLENQINNQLIINEDKEKTLLDENLDEIYHQAAENEDYVYPGEEVYIDKAGN